MWTLRKRAVCILSPSFIRLTLRGEAEFDGRLLAKLGKLGGFGAPEELARLMPKAEDSVTATMEADPDFVLGLFADIGMCGVSEDDEDE